MVRHSAATQAETRARVLEAAFDEFSSRPFSKVSIDDVAARAGFTKGAVYSNFASKRDLLFSVLEQYIDDVGTDYVSATVDGRVDDIATAVGDRAGRTGRDTLRYFRVLSAVWTEAMHDDELAERLRAFRRAHRDRIAAAVVERGSAVGIDLSDVADDLSIGIIAMSVATFFETAIDPDVDPARVHRTMIDLIVAGVLATRGDSA
ncbi:MAG: TetR/AcrR family transcriptional regulator [Actinomycetota bacterium]